MNTDLPTTRHARNGHARLPAAAGLALGATLLVAACTPPVEERVPAPAPGFADPALIDPAAAVAPAPGRYRIDPARSDIRILTGSAGRLAHLGHDHVIEARGFTGDVVLAPRPAASRVRLTLPVELFVVDDPAARARSGPDFADPIDPAGIAGTRRNMLRRDMLWPPVWPTVNLVGVVAGSPAAWPATEANLALTIRIRDVTRQQQVPVVMTALPDGGLRASGRFSIRQTEFGMTPVTALGGALAVRDRVDLVFSLAAAPQGR
jgi:polyisoprenoid-binding protein YceI